MTETELGEYLGQQAEDKEDIKRQFRTGSVLSFFRKFEDKHTLDMTVGVMVRSIAGDILIWDNDTFGKWDTGKWGSADAGSTTFSFALGNAQAAILGTSRLGENLGSWVFHASGA